MYYYSTSLEKKNWGKRFQKGSVASCTKNANFCSTNLLIWNIVYNFSIHFSFIIFLSSIEKDIRAFIHIWYKTILNNKQNEIIFSVFYIFWIRLAIGNLCYIFGIFIEIVIISYTGPGQRPKFCAVTVFLLSQVKARCGQYPFLSYFSEHENADIYNSNCELRTFTLRS